MTSKRTSINETLATYVRKSESNGKFMFCKALCAVRKSTVWRSTVRRTSCICKQTKCTKTSNFTNKKCWVIHVNILALKRFSFLRGSLACLNPLCMYLLFTTFKWKAYNKGISKIDHCQTETSQPLHNFFKSSTFSSLQCLSWLLTFLLVTKILSPRTMG